MIETCNLATRWRACRDKVWTLEEYSKALPLLQIMSSGVPFGRVDKREVDRQRDRITELEDELEKLRSGDALDEKIQKAVQLVLHTNRREQWEELKQTQA